MLLQRYQDSLEPNTLEQNFLNFMYFYIEICKYFNLNIWLSNILSPLKLPF